jgi:hypothetical protein
MEQFCLPNPDKIVAAAREICPVGATAA